RHAYGAGVDAHTNTAEAVHAEIRRAVIGVWHWISRMQMLRYQVVGQLESFIENRANDFRDTVLRSSIDDTTRHQLLTINKLHAWFRREPIFLGKSKTSPGVPIEDDIRHLARSIMRAVAPPAAALQSHEPVD
ncbi:MAG: hypothetical protein ABJO52_19420, partial [Nisaea sp.]|uniref:hypothetical protein n=1 Tax=Nisaea sp. TaxID=2024842 RepID=UPI003298D987